MFDKSDGISLRSGFLRNSAQRPDSPAVVVRGESRSYAFLEEVARRWARAIINVSKARPERVGLFAYRSEVSYAGTLAALFSGAAFVPLNPTFPPEKTASMIQQADPDAIIVDKACAPQLATVLADLKSPPLLMPQLDAAQIDGIDALILNKTALEQSPVLVELPPVTPEDIAYILFTSGSTGAPKGVPVAHRNVVYFIDVMTERYGIGPDDRLSQTFDQTFDLSVFDLFMAWTSGACVYSMAPIELLAPTKFINKNELTLWFSVPSVPAQMQRRNTLTANSMPTLRWSLFCGEPLPQRTAEMWQLAAPNSIVENLYGPTELTIACLLHRWDPQTSPALCHNELVPIGKPYPGLSAIVVDEQLALLPPGEIGELCINGPQTTPGYWRDPARTAERFVNVQVTPDDSRLFYRTGDRVARKPSGDYVFLGRTDHQVKVLGHRVELGEIEAALRRDTLIEHAVALGWPITDGSADGVVAFVSGNEPNTAHLTELAKAALPPYAVPQQIYVVSDMPLNPNGKVDRRVLQERLETGNLS